MGASPHVAVIGAGIAGAAYARAATDAGADVLVFDKARGLGGRMSTRRSAVGTFDHGAQYFTTQGAPFRAQVAHWAQAGTAGAWEPRLAEIEHGAWQPRERVATYWVGTPTMNAPVKHLLDGIEVRRACRIGRVRRRARRWTLDDVEGSRVGSFDALVVATPAAQALPFLEASPGLATVAASVEVAPCWAVLVSTASGADVPYDAATVLDGPLGWVARDSSKPGRRAVEGRATWVLHATAAWSRAHVDAPPTDVEAALLDAFRELPGVGEAVPQDERGTHRWLYARVEQAAGVDHLWDAELALGACGDWCLGPRVEEAWTSGSSLARVSRRP